MSAPREVADLQTRITVEGSAPVASAWKAVGEPERIEHVEKVLNEDGVLVPTGRSFFVTYQRMALSKVRDRARAFELRWVENWRKVLRYSWSIRFAALSFVLSMLEVTFPYLDGVLPVGRGTFGLLAGMTTGASMLARIVAQNAVSGAPATQGAE